MPERNDEPRLPLELERLSFETAASEWPPRNAVPLLLVAKRVYYWARPLMFNFFVHTSHGTCYPDFRKHTSLKLKDVGRYARYLVMVGERDDFELDDLLSSCPNVIHLELFGEPLWSHLKAMTDMRLSKLSAVVEDFPMDQLLTPPFFNLTHLDAIDSSIFERQITWDGSWDVLAALPKLTHLSISDCHSELIRDIFLHCRHLQILLIHDRGNAGADWQLFSAHISDISDERLVPLIEASVDSLQEGLLKGNRDKPMEFWVTAELFMTARRNKFLLDLSLRWIDPEDFDWDLELNDQGKAWFSTLPNCKLV